MCGVLFFGGCGPVAYQPRPIVYNNMPAAQQIVQYENSNPFLQNQKPMQNIQAETQPQHEQNTKILLQQKKVSQKKIAKTINQQQAPTGSVQEQALPQIQLGISASRYQSQISGISYEQCGMIAVMVSVKNQSLQPVYVDIAQFSATTALGEIQPYMPIDVANIAMNSEGFNQAINGAIEGTVAGAAGGALLGGLAAVALGFKFNDGARLGAVSGGIGGMGGGAQTYRQKFAQALSSEIESKKFASRNIYPNTTISGVLFFPSDISNLKLHLPTKSIDIAITN